ncbi:MAG: hemolysin family protein [Thermomicrobiales bacterium]
MFGVGIEILLVIILILFNGVLAMSELAVVSARRARLQQRVDNGSVGARVAIELAEEPTRFLSTVQIGITLVGILAGAFGGATVATAVSDWLSNVPVLDAYSDVLGIILVVLAITYLSLVIGELVPKRLALRNPEGIASLVARPLRAVSTAAHPAVVLLTVSVEAVLRLFGIRPTGEPPVTAEEIEYLIGVGARAGVFEKREQSLVGAIFDLDDRRVSSLMTPRQWIVGIDARDPSDKIQQIVSASRHTHFPVYDSSLDNVLGIVSIKDLWRQLTAGQPLDLQAAMVEPLFVPEQMSVLQMMERFSETGNHKALVIDEFGVVHGLIALNDVIEAIVGDIHGGRHTGEPRAVQRKDGSWLIDGLMPVAELRDLLGVNSFPGEVDEQFQTLGGYLMTALGRVPRAADRVEWDELRFEVVDMDGNRVDKVIVSRDINGAAGHRADDRPLTNK